MQYGQLPGPKEHCQNEGGMFLKYFSYQSKLLGLMVENSLNHPVHLNSPPSRPAIAPCSRGASQCISRESSPGHIDGSDVFYHETTDHVKCLQPLHSQAGVPPYSCSQGFGVWVWAPPFVFGCGAPPPSPPLPARAWEQLLNIHPPRIELAPFSVLG